MSENNEMEILKERIVNLENVLLGVIIELSTDENIDCQNYLNVLGSSFYDSSKLLGAFKEPVLSQEGAIQTNQH